MTATLVDNTKSKYINTVGFAATFCFQGIDKIFFGDTWDFITHAMASWLKGM